MNWFLNSIATDYFNFSGRTTRKEYLLSILVYVVYGFIISVISVIFYVALITLYSPESIRLDLILLPFIVPVIIPFMSLTVRRLNDVRIPKYLIWLFLLPTITGIFKEPEVIIIPFVLGPLVFFIVATVIQNLCIIHNLFKLFFIIVINMCSVLRYELSYIWAIMPLAITLILPSYDHENKFGPASEGKSIESYIKDYISLESDRIVFRIFTLFYYLIHFILNFFLFPIYLVSDIIHSKIRFLSESFQDYLVILITIIIYFVTLIPLLSTVVRRLRYKNKSRRWLLLYIIPPYIVYHIIYYPLLDWLWS